MYIPFEPSLSHLLKIFFKRSVLHINNAMQFYVMGQTAILLSGTLVEIFPSKPIIIQGRKNSHIIVNKCIIQSGYEC